LARKTSAGMKFSRRADHLVHTDHAVEMGIDRHRGGGLERVDGDLRDRLEDEYFRFHGPMVCCAV
jgi:hypothetical protein